MQCNNCGASISEDALFCSQCGTKVEEKVKKICNQCGKELQDNELFCSQCGTKYGEVKEQKHGEEKHGEEKQQSEFEKEWETMCELDDKFLEISNRYYHNFGLVSWPRLNSDDSKEGVIKDLAYDVLLENDFPYEGNNPNQELPIFFFDYDDKIKKTGRYEEGFIFTTRGIRVWYNTMEHRDKWRLIPYESIMSVEHNRALLASVMDVKHGKGKKTRIYLTGITDTKEFVDCVRIFLFGHSSSETKETATKTPNEITSTDAKAKVVATDDIEKIVQEVCEMANFTSVYGKSSADLRKLNYNKCEKVEKNFNILRSEMLYLIFDATLLGSAKAGLVLAGDKVYCKDTFKHRVYSWQEILQMNIVEEKGEVKIGRDFSFIGGGGDAKAVVEIINTIKHRIGN